MKRIEKVFEYLQERATGPNSNNSGLTATEIADNLGFLRSNVSRELNKLYRMGKIDKTSGRPVLYSLSNTIIKNTDKLDTNNSKLLATEHKTIKQEKSAFSNLIGANDSLKTQVEQAKAAVIYPPNGLHTLIVGQTGVGKTLLAHMMFEYGKEVGKFASNAPFVTFNCADYYNNPQLLISHVFGHIKGAFTGADKPSPGLIESADEGILFLDEIHRLPPEGQEMIFYFMDTGTFNRLGETKRERTANVLIIGATTENPDSVLTKTFKRRIPNIITMPSLASRSLKEKLEIVTVLFTEESRSIKRPVKVFSDAIKAIIGSIGNGNVGQLKSNIRLLCAQAFLNGIKTNGHIEITYQMLPSTIKSGILSMSQTREDMAFISHYIEKDLYVTPSSKSKLPKEGEDEPFNLYQMVENKINLLKHEGIAEEIIQQIIVADVNSYVKTFYNQKDSVSLSVYDRLLKIIDADMVDFAQQVADTVEGRIKLVSKERFLYAFGLHLSSLFNRAKDKQPVHNLLEGTVDRNSVEFKLAINIRAMINEKYNVSMSKSETEYFAMLLQSLKEEDNSQKVVIAVVMHGDYTASSMVNVARKLYSASKAPLLAFDMPLECRPDDMLNQIVEQLQNIDCRAGVLLLADMGSLCSFGPIIEERLGVPVRTLGMVTTPFVLEAIRKVDIAGISLFTVYDSLKNFNGYGHNNLVMQAQQQSELKEQAVVTICSTGKGTAEKLQNLVIDILIDASMNHIKVIPIGLFEMHKKLAEIGNKYKIIAIVGVKNPHIDAPFIPIEQIISGQGSIILREIIGIKETLPNKHKDTNIVLKRFCEDGLQEMLLYLNPNKVIDILLKFLANLEKNLDTHWDNPQKLKILIHVGCALERMVIHNSLVYDEHSAGPVNKPKFTAAKDAASIFYDTLQIQLTDDELYYIAAMI